MINKRNFSQATPLTRAQAAGLAREVLESARQALRDTPAPDSIQARRTAPRGAAARRRWRLPAAFAGLARFPEMATITLCMLVCAGGVVQHRFF